MTKSKLREQWELEALPASEYFNVANVKVSPKAIIPQSKGQKVEADPYRTGQSENEVRKECRAFLKRHHFETVTIYTGGIPLGNGLLATNPAKGFPDNITFKPHQKQLFYIEFKKNSGGRLSQDQLNWHAALRACNEMVFVITSVQLLEVVLKKNNLI